MTDELRRAWAYLSRVAEGHCAQLNALVSEVGPLDAVGKIKAGDIEPSLASLIGMRGELDCAADDLDVLDRMGGRLITPGDDEWPSRAFEAFNAPIGSELSNGHPPLVLWAVGPENLVDLADRAVAVVGSRAATAYGEHVAADLAAGIAARGVAVVSGGGYGVDGSAHRGALACEGPTVAVMAAGIDTPYPAGHSALFRRIGDAGLLVSESPPGSSPGRVRFVARNRLIAALSAATVVVESGLRGGAMNTAGWAKTLGRQLGAVPGPVTSAASQGCHALLRDGATLVSTAEQVVELMGTPADDQNQLNSEPAR